MNEAQQDVLDVLRQYGPLPDQALVPLAQHLVATHQSSSGIRTRRAELTRLGYLQRVDDVKLSSGRSAAVWGVKL